MKICFDIDGVICTQSRDMNYGNAMPIWFTINLIKELKDAKHTIILHTARGSETGIDWRKVTEEQMVRWGVPYDKLVMGKPAADYYVDDRAMGIMGINRLLADSVVR